MEFTRWLKYANKLFALINPNYSDDSCETSADTVNSIRICAVVLLACQNNLRTWRAMYWQPADTCHIWI